MIKVNRYQPTTLETKLYTVSRAARILKLKRDQIEFIYPCSDGCLIGLWNDSVFISKVEFIKLLSTDRRQRSKALKVTENVFDNTVFTVRNENKGRAYRVEAHQDYINCGCKDYENLSQDLGTNKVSCKHIYAVLGFLGHSSLNEYINHNKPLREPSEYGTYHMAQGHY